MLAIFARDCSLQLRAENFSSTSLTLCTKATEFTSNDCLCPCIMTLCQTYTKGTMPYQMKVPEKDALGEAKYTNAKGHTECVEFVRQTTNAPPTILWKPGVKVADAKFGEIPRGTAIATFDDNDKYPTDALGQHAA